MIFVTYESRLRVSINALAFIVGEYQSVLYVHVVQLQSQSWLNLKYDYHKLRSHDASADTVLLNTRHVICENWPVLPYLTICHHAP